MNTFRQILLTKSIPVTVFDVNMCVLVSMNDYLTTTNIVYFEQN